MHSSHGLPRKITALALVLMLVTLWLLMHGYQGLTGDAQIYAFQALARIHPQLATDLYLQNTSQDQFTIFSPVYAWFIGLMGLENAARLLTLIFNAWLLAAAWSFVRAITGREAAWLAVAFLLIVPGNYGGSDVFRLSEHFLTARLPAEALIVTALACHVRGMKVIALLLASGAMLVHPLMALPGLLLLLCLELPLRFGLLGALAGVLVTLGIAVAAATLPSVPHAMTVMDPAWLDVVRERSQFLLLQLWSVHDWNLNAQPFLYLAFTAIAVQDERLRRLCLAAALVGAAGLAVALIAGLVGPVALLVQGQAWRWVWIPVLISALLLPHTALQVWRDEKCGPLLVILLVLGWTCSAIDGTACVSLALALWVLRAHISVRAAPYFRWAAIALGIAILAWIFTQSWAILAPTATVSAHALAHAPASIDAARIREIFGLNVPAVLLVVLVWWWLRRTRTQWVPTLLATVLLATSIAILPTAFKETRTLGSAMATHEFADWMREIPPMSTVLVTPTHDVGAFVWFTLQRPNYLAVDQSAGVVFSRRTAIEVRRRSNVLLPLMDPNWKILTRLRADAAGKRKIDAATRSLTATRLRQVCTDPKLGYVISPQKVGFDPVPHERPGAMQDWNLYDCRQVRAALPLS